MLDSRVPRPRQGGSSLIDPADARDDASLVRSIIERRAFRPVFQPIYELESRAIVGYEALTRFAAGRPDRIFAAARASGLHAQLEEATLREALRAAGTLPAAALLHLNVSADLILANEPLAGMLRSAGWQVVLELTEDIEITDYAAFRTALAQLGSGAMLAVDDAGSGFASLRHLVELGPAFVKLDRTLVSGIGQSTAKQALVAGLNYYALRTGAVLIAEGIESATAVRTLVSLGVALGQGFYTARPAPAQELLRPPPPPPGWPAADRDPASRPEPIMDPHLPIERVVNIGPGLGTVLHQLGIHTFGDLVAAGAVGTWRRMRTVRPRLATAATLLALGASIEQVRPSMLSATERGALGIIARVEGRDSGTAD